MQTYLTPKRMELGLCLVLPGIEGYGIWNRNIANGIARGGFPGAIEIHDWTRGKLFYLWNLRSRKRHQEQALVLADKIVAYQDRHPGQPVHLVGHSGGAAMIAFTLEKLPPERRITCGVLLLPALSPGYPMDVAVARTERGLWHVSSRWDFWFLGVGTLVAGTTDGRHCVSAGNVGFTPEVMDRAALSEQQRIHRLPYHFGMLRTGHWGGHLSVSSPRFIAEYVAPKLLPSVHSKS